MQPGLIVDLPRAIARFVAEPATDARSVRGLLRHHLAPAIEGIVAVTLVAAAVLQLGNPGWFLALAAYTGGLVLLDRYVARSDNRISPQVGFRLAILSWPAAFVLLGLAGWSGTAYHGEVVAVIAMLVSGLVGLVYSLRVAVAWSLAGTAGIVIGAAVGGALGRESMIAAGGVVAGAVFGNRLHQVIEGFLGSRRRLLHEVTRVPSSPDPFAAAQSLLEPLVRHIAVGTVSIAWFTADGRSVILGIIGKNLPAILRPGAAIPDHRNLYLRSHAASGPWITGWTVTEGDEGYSRTVAAAGIDAVAYMPLVHEGRTIGLLTAAVGNAAGGKTAAAEYVPILAEVADIVATTLGPQIAGLEERTSATHLIDEILRERRFWPVFQPIRNLHSSDVVGFEALTRFDAPVSTQRLFDEAALLGRGKELEVATMKAAVKAAAKLPPGRFVSINASAALLAETGTIGDILAPLDRAVVIELSEHEVITDYEPIAAAMRRLGPSRALAVDDAGAGFASLRHILEVRPEFVKMDIGLVQGASTDLTRRALVAGFVHFARDAEFTLIAEGIESVEDLETLKRLGVAMGQGFRLGQPERVAAFRERAASAPRRRRAARSAAS